MTDQLERKSFPLKDVPTAYALGWRFDSQPSDLIHDETPIPMKKAKHGRTPWVSNTSR